MPFLPIIPRLIIAAGLLATVAARAATPVWVEKSNAHAKVLLDATNKFGPEGAGATGFDGFDADITDLKPGINERTRAALATARDELKRRLAAESDALVRQDLEILIQSADDQIESSLLFEKHILPYFDLNQLVFFGEFSLLQDQIAEARRPAALTRLKKYTGLEPGYTSVFELGKALYVEAAKDSRRIGPYKASVEQALANLSRYTQGIRQLYAKYGLDKHDGAAAALAAYEKQAADFNEWVRVTVLPRARTDHRLPPEIYANNLKNVGLDIPPQELIRRAETFFGAIRSEMNTIAALIAKERGWSDPDYRAVIAALRKEQVPAGQIESTYRGIITQLEDIIRRERIVTLPDRPMLMRIASEAETALQPAAHMQPPPLVNNQGERGTFVLPLGNPSGGNSQAYDDFSYKAAMWTLTAHEGRPGHELQYSAMVERGVSQARSIFAFNSVNVEGWALYAEAEAKPYEPLEGQLCALQARLHRSARAFLDPMLNLGLLTPERAKEILVKEACISPAYAQQEIDRYMFRAPGQATAYFYGYMRLMELRTATEITLGARFDRLAFNNFILDQGLLPPDLIAKAVREQFVPAQLAK